MSGDQIHLTVAGVGLTLHGEGVFRAVLQSERYRPFLSASPSAAEVEVGTAEVNWDSGLNNPQMVLDGWSVSYRIIGGEGAFDAAAGTGWLRMTADENVAHGVLGNYVRIAYALLFIRHGGFLFHSAGMIRNGHGLLFYGHSGSGKSTVSHLSQRRATLLSDDLVAVRPRNDVWHVHGTPFWGDLDDLAKTAASAPLRGLFGLVKDTQVRLERLSAAQRALAVAEVVSSVPVTSQDPDLSRRLVDLCADVVVQVPVYRLHFRRDDAFWNVLDEELDRNQDDTA